MEGAALRLIMFGHKDSCPECSAWQLDRNTGFLYFRLWHPELP